MRRVPERALLRSHLKGFIRSYKKGVTERIDYQDVFSLHVVADHD
jgi:hypothetical protein